MSTAIKGVDLGEGLGGKGPPLSEAKNEKDHGYYVRNKGKTLSIYLIVISSLCVASISGVILQVLAASPP